MYLNSVMPSVQNNALFLLVNVLASNRRVICKLFTISSFRLNVLFGSVEIIIAVLRWAVAFQSRKRRLESNSPTQNSDDDSNTAKENVQPATTDGEELTNDTPVWQVVSRYSAWAPFFTVFCLGSLGLKEALFCAYTLVRSW